MALSGRCLYEIRGVNAGGAVAISPTDSATAFIVLSEQRDYQPDKDMSWQIRGNSIKGQVSSITLVDQNGATKFTMPVDATANPALSGGFVRQSEGANLNGLFDVLTTRLAKVVITLNNGTSVTIPLYNITRNDWNRPYCS
jgi:hypothetical protein